MIFNRLKTAVLLATLSGIFMLIGGLISGKDGVTVALVLSLVINFITYYFSDKIVLNIYRAKKLDEAKYNWVYSMVKDLAIKSEVPMPKLWLVDLPMANAFATGRNPKNGSIAVTTGILKILTHEELRGVLAHEISHIKNRDILISTVAATLATAIGYVANMAYYSAIFSSKDSKRKGANPIILLLVSFLMPLAAMIIQMAISRSREYMADESGAETSRDPMALASALEKLHKHIPEDHLDEHDNAKASTASLFIVHPFTSGNLMNLFSTHPPMSERIKRLKNMADYNEVLNRKKEKE